MGVPKEARTGQRNHLDTKILWALLDEDENRDLRKKATGLFSRKNHPSFVISLPVVGEFFSMFAERNMAQCEKVANAGREFAKYLRRSALEIYITGERDTKVFDIANELSQEELDPVDCMIIACAIWDKRCTVLYMEDRRIIDNRYISDKIKDICIKMDRDILHIKDLGD